MWLQWVLLVCAWVLSTLCIRIWPRLKDLEIEVSTDIVETLLYQPFHYLTGFLFLVFFIFIVSHIIKKIIYECRIAFLFRTLPYQALVILLITLVLYTRVMYVLFHVTLALTVVILFYNIFQYIAKRKEEVFYVRE